MLVRIKLTCHDLFLRIGSHFPRSTSIKLRPIFRKIMKPNDPIDYELQFSVKDWCLMKTDLLVGVAVMPLRQVVETGSIQDRLDLGRSLCLTKENLSVVIILSQRVHDEVAQEFVKLKKLERTEIV